MYDVVIIGAGIVGGSIFRELTKYNLNVLILDKDRDVAMGTSKANSAIVHAGYDPEPETLMAKLNVEGNKMFEEICEELSVPFKRNGSMVLGFDEKDKKTLEHLYENGIKNGVEGLKLLSKNEVLHFEPNIKENVIGALYAPTGGIIGAYEVTIALIENGIDNGGKIKLSSEVVNIEKQDTFKTILSTGEVIESKYVINCAGVYADKIHNMICEESYKIHPRKGEYFIMDKSQGDLSTHTLFQCPSELGKGVLVSPTVHGNLIVGPDSEDGEDKEDLSTGSENLNFIREKATKTTDKINFRESIRNFSGLRAISDRKDFIIEESKDVKGFIDVAGIKSPGLSSAPAIGIYVVKMLEDMGLKLNINLKFNPFRKQVHFIELSPKEKAELIKRDKRYGRIICRCENITEGEIVDSINRTLGATTVDGVKRRCRPGCGRCQGGFCGPRVQEIIAREKKIKMEDIVLDKENSYILTGKTK